MNDRYDLSVNDRIDGLQVIRKHHFANCMSETCISGAKLCDQQNDWRQISIDVNARAPHLISVDVGTMWHEALEPASEYPK